jgi:HSP20 family molecular chaperone IbpA
MFHYYTNRPATNEYQFEDKFVIQVILPGHTKEGLSIEVLSGNKLVIQSKPNITAYKDFISKDEDYTIKPVKVVYNLPKSISIEDINSTLKDGVLTITIPKKEDTSTYKVNIE